MKRLLLCAVPVLALLGAFFASSVSGAGETGTHPYVGSKSCKGCHIKEWKSWSQTTMAKTFSVLEAGAQAAEKTKAGLDPDKDYTRDPNCLGCHTTGYGQPGGFTDLEKTPELVGVGCEMCHGPGGTYLQKPYMSFKNKEYKRADLVAVGLVAKVGAGQCTVCHNSDSPSAPKEAFDFEADGSKGTHERFPLKYNHD